MSDMITYYFTRYGETGSFGAENDKAAMKKMADNFGSQLLGLVHVWTDDTNGDIHTVWMLGLLRRNYVRSHKV